MRESLFISVITNQSEVWVNTTEKDLTHLESLNANLICWALQSNSKTSKCIMLLELGLKPIRYYIMQKRMMYLHKLLTKGKNTLASKVLHSQMKNTLKGDWYKECLKDIKELKFNRENIESFTKNGMNKALKEAIEKAAIKYLLKEKDKQSKGKELFYSSLQTQSYFKPDSNLSSREMKQMFQIRSRNLPLKDNFPNQFSDRNCVIPECAGQDSQRGLFHCNYLEPMNIILETGIEYEDIFSNNVSKQRCVMKVLYQKYESRLKYLASLTKKGTPGDQEESTSLGSRVH